MPDGVAVYVAPEVEDVDRLHPYVRDVDFRAQTIREQLAAQSDTVFRAHRQGDRRLRMQVMCWWPAARGISLDAVMAGSFTEDDARQTVALEHGYESWHTVNALGDTRLSLAFEDALDAMLNGDLATLNEQLKATPSLTETRTEYGHRATLLHYIGANGVESHRQRTPHNAPHLARLLIDQGADVAATVHIYGGAQTALALASTSAHPHNAGISDELNRVLGASD